MESSNEECVGLNVIQALSSSAATASTLNHPIDESGTPPLDSNSVSQSEGDGLDNVPPPPPPLGIETQFDMLHLSPSDPLNHNMSHDHRKDKEEYHRHQNASRKTIFQKLHNLGLGTSNDRVRRNILHDDENDFPCNEYNRDTENIPAKDGPTSTYTTPHFATLRRMCTQRQGKGSDISSPDNQKKIEFPPHFARGISIDEVPHDRYQLMRSRRRSGSSTSRKSIANYNNIDTRGSNHFDEEPTQKAKSGSMSSLSSRGSTLSWFRRKSRSNNKGIVNHPHNQFFNILAKRMV